MRRNTVARDSSTHDETRQSDADKVSGVLTRVRAVVRELNRVAARMDRKLGQRLRQLEALRR